jgi:hypothetical protein
MIIVAVLHSFSATVITVDPKSTENLPNEGIAWTIFLYLARTVLQ